MLKLKDWSHIRRNLSLSNGEFTPKLHKYLVWKRFARSISGHQETIAHFQDLTVCSIRFRPGNIQSRLWRDWTNLYRFELKFYATLGFTYHSFWRSKIHKYILRVSVTWETLWYQVKSAPSRTVFRLQISCHTPKYQPSADIIISAEKKELSI